MASPNTTIRIQEHCHVTPQPSPQQKLSLPLSFFDLVWLRFHPVERIFFYSHPTPHEVVPKLKTSLSLTLQHFLPVAGSIIWPSESYKPEIQYNPGDGVSLTVAESNQDFEDIIDKSPRPASQSRCFVPELDSSDSRASVISFQITIFPNSGLSIGISSHHAVLDGKSTTTFVKAWAYASKQQIVDNQSLHSLSLPPQLVPLFDKEVIKDPNGRDIVFINIWTELCSKFEPNGKDGGRSLEIMSSAFPPLVDNAVRATFELTRGDLEKIKEKVLSMWNSVDVANSSPPTLSTFVLTCAYVSTCIARATEEAERGIDAAKPRFVFGFTVDCRARLHPPVPGNYFGNCVCGNMADPTKSEDFVDHEHGLVVMAKKIQRMVKELNIEVLLEEMETIFKRATDLMSVGMKTIGVAGSTRFGDYGVDFGWGKPAKVEIASVDRSITIGMTDGGKGGVEVGLVLKEYVMGRFREFFMEGLQF